MTARSFTDALAIVLKEEGGYVDDGRDPGRGARRPRR